jgi:hypothetical protein
MGSKSKDKSLFLEQMLIKQFSIAQYIPNNYNNIIRISEVGPG